MTMSSTSRATTGWSWRTLFRSIHMFIPCIYLNEGDDSQTGRGFCSLWLSPDNAACFLSAEFQTWCEQRGIQHLHGAPYHPETNGAADRLVQTFKQSLKKSDLPPVDALHNRRTPLASGSIPSELLNGRQIPTKLDIIVPQQIQTPARDREEPAPTRRLTKDSPCHTRRDVETSGDLQW